MNVRELIEQLSKLDPELPVVYQNEDPQRIDDEYLEATVGMVVEDLSEKDKKVFLLQRVI
jgi:hypothetical protein